MVVVVVVVVVVEVVVMVDRNQGANGAVQCHSLDPFFKVDSCGGICHGSNDDSDNDDNDDDDNNDNS